jgi:hypothetical protein
VRLSNIEKLCGPKQIAIQWIYGEEKRREEKSREENQKGGER